MSLDTLEKIECMLRDDSRYPKQLARSETQALQRCVPYIICDPYERMIVSVGEATERMLGYKSGELDNKPVFDLVPPDKQKLVASKINDWMEDPHPLPMRSHSRAKSYDIRQLKIDVVKRNGELLPVLMSIEPYINGTVKLWAVITMMDITAFFM